MRSERTNESQRPMLRLVGDGEGESGSAFTISGWLSQSSTTSHRTQSQALSESLSYLESGIDDLESRYLEVCATLNLVMARLVELNLFGINTDTTKP